MMTVLRGVLGVAGAVLLLYGVGTVAMWRKGERVSAIRKFQAGVHVLLVIAFAVFVLWLVGLLVEMFWRMVVT